MLRGAVSGMVARCREIAATRGTDAYLNVGPPPVAGQSPRCLVVQQPLTGGPDEQTGGDAVEQAAFRLSWYDETADECWEALHDIEKSFRSSRPALGDGCTCIGVTVGGSTVMLDPSRTPEARDVWRGLIGITLLVQRSLTA